MSGVLGVFYIGTDDHLYCNIQDPNASGGWTGETPLYGGPVKSLVAARNADGRLEVFYIGGDNNLYHNYQDPNSPSGWSGEVPLGGSAKSLVIAGSA
jgi:hypothetical protein